MKNKYLVILIFVAALFIPRQYAFYFFPAAIFYILYLDIHLFRFIRRFSFLLLVIILLLLQPLIVGEKDLLFLGIKISSNGLSNGLIMVLRAVVMIPAISYLSKTADRKQLQKLFSKIGIQHFDQVLDQSQKLFPLLKEKSREFFVTTDRKKIFNPLELTAQFFAFLIKSTNSYTPKIKQEKVL
jgi:energy-coupling factor transporter transmembrane protein EcfT